MEINLLPGAKGLKRWSWSGLSSRNPTIKFSFYC